MKRSFLLLVLLVLGVFYFLNRQNSEKQTANNAQDTTLEDILEPRPEKKINQPPKSKTKSTASTDSESKEKTTIGIFLLLERGDYTYLHIKDEKNQEASFQIWAAYEGAADLNVDNWGKVKGKKIKVTWEESEEKIQERGETVKMKKLLGVEIL